MTDKEILDFMDETGLTLFGRGHNSSAKPSVAMGMGGTYGDDVRSAVVAFKKRLEGSYKCMGKRDGNKTT